MANPQPNPSDRAASVPGETRDDGYPLRGTVVLTLMYLLLVIAGWAYVYFIMIQDQ